MGTDVINPIPKNEYDRIIELSELDLDYSDLKDQFSDLTKLAAKVAGTEVSLINLIDSFTQWSVANYGIKVDQMPREDSVCQYTIMENEPLKVEDLSADTRFSEKDYVKGEADLQFYFGIPLRTKNGNNIGALCVMDKRSKQLPPEKVEMLTIIADEIVDRLLSFNVINELRERAKEASESNRKLSHDLRGPIGGIIGLAQIIEEQGNTQTIEDILDLVEMIRKGGQSVLELADEILTERPADKEVSLDNNEFNLNSLKDKLEQLYTPQATAKNIDLTVANESENAQIPFPRKKILQILGNVISNAIKFTPEGGMVMVRQEYIKGDEENRLYFTVKDTGIGISEDKITDILNGVATSTNGTEGESGYGFGLTLVKHLIEKLNGRIDITSEKGEGSKFYISLPLQTSK